MIRGLFILFIVLFYSNVLEASGHYDFNHTARAIYTDILILKLEKAETELKQALENDPDNGIYKLLENYHQLLELLILDDRDVFEAGKKIFQQRLKHLKKGETTSPWHRYCEAEVMLQWSILEYKYGNWWQSFNNVHNAYTLLNKNKKEFPDFIPTYRSLGLIHAFMGTLPMSKSMKWIVKQLSGMYGSIEEGMNEIQRVLHHAGSNDYVFKEETHIIYAYMLLHVENKKESAWQTINNMKGPISQGLLLSFVKADLALTLGKLNECLYAISQSPKGDGYHTVSFLELIEGKALLYRDDERAERVLKSFINKHKGDTFRFATYQKLAWYYLVRGNEEAYDLYINYCKDGNNELLTGKDKEAHREALSGVRPDPILLRARIMFDGAQYGPGIELLEQYSIDDVQELYKMEYFYRLGRLKQGAGLKPEAILLLGDAYSKGISSSSFMVCNAALQIGLIYEQVGNNQLAKTWLQKALAHKPKDYRRSLHGKARTALKRIKLLED